MLKRLTLILALIVLSLGRASAQVNFTDIVIDDATGSQTITLSIGINYLRYTADRDAVLQFQGGWAVYVYNSDETGTDQLDQLSSEAGATGRVFSTSVQSGQTYYFRTSIVMDPFDLVITYEGSGATETPITIAANYDQGATYITTGSNAEFVFDRRVTVDHAWLVYGTGAADRIEIADDYINSTFFNQYYYSITLRDVVQALVDLGHLTEGAEFSIVLEGIADAADPTNTYGTDGTFVLRLKLGAMPATLVSASPADGSTITNYYPEDGTQNIITLTFSEALDPDCNPTVTISYGDVEAGSYVTKSAPWTISGEVMTIDLTGNNFPETIESSAGQQVATVVSITVSGLRAASGRTVQSNYASAGSTSIGLSYYVSKEAISFYYDFIPFNGAESLAGYDEIVVWVSSPIAYSGILVEWSDARGGARQRTFTPEEAPFEWSDDLFGYVARVPLGAISYGQSPVTVTVVDAILPNGDGYAITGTFNTNPAATGINAIIGPDNTPTAGAIYSATGALIAPRADRATIQSLRPGIYVVGGKKFVK